MRKTRRLLTSFRVLLMKSASLSLLMNQVIPILKLWLRLKHSALRMLRRLLTQTTSLFVTRLSFLSMRLFTRNLTSVLKAASLSLMRLCTLFRSTLFVHGSRTSIRELTAEVLTKSVLLMLKLICLQEFTAQVFSPEVRLRCFQLQHLVL